MDNTRINYWTQDLDQLAKDLPRLHNNLFFTLGKDAFYKSIEELKSNLDVCDDLMVLVNISKIIASVRDAHTTLIMPLSRLFPFEFYYFPEGIHIISTTPKYSDLLHCKVLEINEISMDEIIEEFSYILSYENKSFFQSQLPKYLKSVEILYGMQAVDQIKEVKLKVQNLSGDIIDILVQTISISEFSTSIVNSSNSESLHPLYRRSSEKNFWSYFLADDKTLYFNYKSCKDMPGRTVEDFCAETMRYINNEDVNKLVIDIRNNLGGNSQLLEPFIRELRKCDKLKAKGSIYVIIGRETFSSALLNAFSLKNKTNAIFVGEPSGGKPNCYGEVQYFELQNSHLSIRYSTQYYKIIKNDKIDSLYPDVGIELTLMDYIANVDPCLKYILDN